jgi:hypothetical protein
MRTLTNVELLDVWEAGLSQTAVERALSLVAASMPGIPVEELARLSVGQRDLRLFELRRATFGDALPMTAACPACGEQVEASVNVGDLLVGGATVAEDELVADGVEVRFRLPNSIDLAAISDEETTEDAALRLLASCIVEARRGEDVLAVAELPGPVITQIADRMAELDPQADVELALTCPECAHRWVALLDIAEFLWAEVQNSAKRLLRDVHALALAYGWREPDVLALSAARRQAYLEMIG